MARSKRLSVFVENAEGQPVTDAEVKIRAAGEKDFRPLTAGVMPGHFEGTGLAEGTYEVAVSGKGEALQPESREVRVSRATETITMVLGREGQPFYYAGETKIYFEPDRESFLLVTRGERAPEITMRHLRTRDLAAERHPPVILPRDAGEKAAGQHPPDAAFVSVKLPEGQPVEQAGELMASVAEELREEGLQVTLALTVRRPGQGFQGLTNELVVRFQDHVSQPEVQTIARQVGLVVERPILYAGNAFLMSRPGPPSYDLLRIAQVLRDQYPVRYVEPNLLVQIELDQYTPDDTLFGNQGWMPLINCDDAWQTLGAIDLNIRGGSADITIAVFDGQGVAPDHPELTANVSDGTSKLVTSFNFNAMATQTVAQLAGDHGTQCAGSATAAFDNNLGIAGIAPNCHLIGARLPSPVTGIEMADAFIWAAGFNTGSTAPGFPALPARAADVISNSWGVTWGALSATLQDCFDFLTVYGRGGRGCIVTFSVGNLGYVPFSNRRTYAAYERTIAVGASVSANPSSPIATSCVADPGGDTTDLTATVDTRTLYSPYGPETDVVAPSHTTYIPPCNVTTLLDPILSIVRVGTGNLDGCPGGPVCNDYAASFGGTSHSSPCVAATAALILSVNPALSWVQVREILRTTAVRIDNANTDPIGQYVDNDGDGVAEFSQWYGYGRIDVNAAVTATRDLTFVADIVARDNLADVGTVPSAGWHAHSPDIWVRRSDDPIPALAYASAPPHQSPRRGQNNYVYCRVKNIGTAASNEVYVRAMITHFPGFEFRYPEEFIPTNRPGDPIPSPLVPGTYLIDEVQLDELAPGADQIVKMTWPAALVPPATVAVGGTTVTWHPCLLLEASPHDGPMPAGATFDIKRDNNIAQRNIAILEPGDPASDLFLAIIAGTSAPAGVTDLVIDRSRLAPEADVFVRLAEPRLMEILVEHVKGLEPVEPAPGRQPCDIRLLTPARVAVDCCDEKTLVITAPAGTRFTLLCAPGPGAGALRLGTHQDLQVVQVGDSSALVELPLRLAQGEFTPVLIAAPPHAGGSRGELRLTQRRGDGELSAGFTVA
jgi:subtilisin family serine protease